MDQTSIAELNHYNHEFYSVHAKSFSKTRAYPWQGWNSLLPILQENYLASQIEYPKTAHKILDIGCGNGRFLQFFIEHFSKTHCEYAGVDLSETLLQVADAVPLPASFQKTLYKLDLVETLQSTTASTLKKSELNNYNLVAIFGVLHHIPTLELRKKMLSWAFAQIAPGGLLVMTFWQFALTNSTKKIPVQTDDFSENDHLLPWKSEEKQRYAHHFSEEEIAELIISLPQATVLSQFNADGKQKLNRYVILKKTSKGV
jgi:tRNA (uracil-5-)-methyltransferase TRM9